MSRTRATAVLAALLLAVLPSLAAPASADGTITTQAYVGLLGLDRVHARGILGQGVTIAMVENAPDTTVPELAGADVTTTPVCTFTEVPEKRAHATAVASILVSQAYGWAPGARLLAYAIPIGDVEAASAGGCPVSPTATAIEMALDSGANVISLSLAGHLTATEGYALARAAAAGVPVVVGAGNDAQADPRSSMATSNLTVGVGSTDMSLAPADFSTYGEGITVTAPGTDITMRVPDATGALSQVNVGATGTSFSAPMVAGLLALARQHCPDATGNQLLQALITSSDRDGDGWDRYYGWGVINPQGMLSTDPTALEDTNPLTRKFTAPDIHPTAKEQSDYADGLVELTADSILLEDPSYIYRGLDEAVLLIAPERTALGTSPSFDD